MTKKAIENITKEKEFKTCKLNLGWCGLSEIPAELLEMYWLEELYLGSNEINEIKNLEVLTNLKSLNLTNNKITEIKNLECLTNLVKFEIANNEITEIKNLDYLKNLEILSLSGNQITEIKNLECLIKLKELSLDRNKISELKNLSRLQNLEYLSLSSNRIIEIQNLTSLRNLEFLDLCKNNISKVEKLPLLLELTSLRLLRLFGIGSNNLNIPPELFGNEPPLSNCLAALRGYFASLKKGSFQLKELPIILVGNSTAGKTSLRYFLQNNIFPPPKDYSTHGIESSVWQPDNDSVDNLDEDIKPKNLQLYFWDFGGQEYYHSTHRLFFSKKAIYILVWEKRTNKQMTDNISIKVRKTDSDIELKKLPIELFPYEYWLQSIRYQAADEKESPIFLVQNKIDEEGNEEEDVDPLLLKANNCKALKLSIKRAYQISEQRKKDPLVELLLQKIFTAAKDLSSTIRYGALWEDIKKMLQEVRKENIWTVEKFKQEVKLFDPVLEDNSIMLSYIPSLDKIKALLYFDNEPVLQNYVFLNPGWVTEMIYSILDQSVIENKGEFEKAHLVKKTGDEYSGIFIALMKKFELIFYNEELNVFIAPQYLSNELNDQRKSNELKVRFDLEKPDFILQFKSFMPRYIMLRFLVAYGEKAISKYYWKNGVAFTIEKCSVLVLSDYDRKQFRVFTENKNKYIQRLIFDKLVELSDNKESLMLGVENNDIVAYNELQEEFPAGRFSGNNNIKSINGEWISLTIFKDFFEELKTVKRKFMDTKANKIKIFISYAHVDEEIRKLFEERYLKAIQNYYAENIEVWSDIKLKPATGWDNKIKNEINSADIIIFFLSNGFLSSNYIKEIEIEKALERYRDKKQIIVPVYIEKIARKLLPFSDKQYLPSGKPLKNWRPQNDAWVKIQDGLIKIIDDIRNGNIGEYFE